ncbi:amidohydrolase [Agrococcus sp. HG114]|uniref:amidohydrolase n=1 Tax=Agrococcus sp. HG114 TaxID=2969757 RepID=UPI00215B1E34|nr:amidohydrolase [Agrococcus sp. HG114]MCR8670017.1 amidohydrolase [Agrococcus sp. HG114]
MGWTAAAGGSVRIDAIIDNARVLTGDPRRPLASRIGIWQGRVVGLDEELDGARPDRRFDAEGGVLLPGFNDAHAHSVWFGQTLAELDLSAARTPADVDRLIAERAGNLEGDAWVVAAGFNPLGMSGPLDRDALDRAAGGRPVWIKHTSGHAATLNGVGLARIGVGDEPRPDPDGGVIVRDDRGRPTGLLEENAMRLVQDVLLPDPLTAIEDALGRATAQYAREGITSVTDAGIAGGWIGHSPREFAAYQRARDRGLLRTRMQAMVTLDALADLDGHVDDPRAIGLTAGIRSGIGDDRLQVGPVKVFTDGSLLGSTAAMSEDYAHDHGNHGYLQGDPKEMRARVLAAAAGDWALALHAIGDAAVDFALDLIDEAQRLYGRGPLPSRIEHGGVVRPDQLDRMARLGVALVPQPRFIAEFGDGMAAKLGAERTHRSYPAASVLRAGAVLAGSSDRPVAPGEPLRIVQSFVERRTESGAPYGPDERLTVEQALRACTAGAAQATGWGGRKGVLARGMLADIVALGDDPRAVPTDRIGQIDVVATLVGGEAVHGALAER